MDNCTSQQQSCLIDCVIYARSPKPQDTTDPLASPIVRNENRSAMLGVVEVNTDSPVGFQQEDGTVDEQPEDTFNYKNSSKLKGKTDVAYQFNPNKYNHKTETSKFNTCKRNDKENSGLGHGAVFQTTQTAI